MSGSILVSRVYQNIKKSNETYKGRFFFPHLSSLLEPIQRFYTSRKNCRNYCSNKLNTEIRIHIRK